MDRRGCLAGKALNKANPVVFAIGSLSAQETRAFRVMSLDTYAAVVREGCRIFDQCVDSVHGGGSSPLDASELADLREALAGAACVRWYRAVAAAPELLTLDARDVTRALDGSLESVKRAEQTIEHAVKILSDAAYYYQTRRDGSHRSQDAAKVAIPLLETARMLLVMIPMPSA